MAVANDIHSKTVLLQPKKGRLLRSKSCVQSSNHGGLSQISHSVVKPQPSLKTVSQTLSARGQYFQPLELIDVPLCEPSFEERKERISGLLAKIKKEQPLSKCSLFKMPLTFRWFVWSSSLDSLYGFQNATKSEKLLEAPLFPVKKPLQRSNSAQTINPSQSSSKRKPLDSSKVDQVHNVSLFHWFLFIVFISQIARKDAVRLNMLSSVQPAIKLKNQVKLNNQIEISSHRSLKLGAIPKYFNIGIY